MTALPDRLGQLLRHRWVLPAAIAALMLLFAWLFWPAGEGERRVRVIQEVTLVTPPPPPPPEEKIMEEEPEIVEPTEEPEVQKDTPTPTEDATNDQPTEQPSEAAGLNQPADQGSDSFRLSAGKGGGLFGRGGGGGGDGGWAGYVETHIRKALRLDPRTRSAQGFLNVTLNIDPNGAITDAVLRTSTGDAKLDAAVRDVLSRLPPLGRGRPAAIGGLTYTTINMRRIG